LRKGWETLGSGEIWRITQKGKEKEEEGEDGEKTLKTVNGFVQGAGHQGFCTREIREEYERNTREIREEYERNTRGIYGESFETAVSWDKCVPMIDAVRDTVTREHARFGVAGTPFFTARVSQVYGSGVCVYFYYAVLGDGLDDPSHVYEQIETACRATILCNGGSLSHHHGVGRHRAKFMGQQLGDTAVATLDRMKCPVFSI
jgi:FAD/FMN-containing dehydrogenase